MPIDPVKLHDLASKYDPLPILQAMEELSKQVGAKNSGPPVDKAIEQSLMQPVAQPGVAQPPLRGPWS